jgi:hypothetical protein
MTESNVGKKEKISKKYEFDAGSNLTKMYRYSWQFGKIHRQYIYSSFQKKRLPENITLNGKGEEIIKKTYTYNIDTLLTEQVKYKKGAFFSKLTYKYDSTRLTESDYYIKNSEVPKEKWVYEYYANHSKKRSTFYKKGKVKYVWNYECKEEGELIKKHKDTTMICENTEFDIAGNKTVTLRKFNQKGKPYKEVYVYNKENKIIETRFYNEKDILINKFVQNPDNFSTVWYYFNNKGMERYRYENIYNSKNNIIEESRYKNQNILTSKKTYNYNENNILLSTMSIGKKNKLRLESKYLYNDRDMLTSQKVFNGKGKLKKEIKLTYLFF